MVAVFRSLLQTGLAPCTVVEFAAGGGHLGLVIAYLFPCISVVLLDRKTVSLEIAKRRALEAGLTNVSCVLADIVDYSEPFEVGIALHPCGVAADAVLAQCRLAGAAFVVAPCCYGKLAVNCDQVPPIARSSRASALGVPPSTYPLLATAADYSCPADESSTDSAWDFDCSGASQAQWCMGVLNTDRGFAAKDSGYTTTLTRMQPFHCTPKNQILSGWGTTALVH
eukprot:NODE_280_length_2022_cov_68.468829_g192_i0.p1 GENE.NODE_280_length_2022_cov_68.468829_g192_i0~~NODE_280_length_2022_cov_68.468829_g192_i0.p1  ORF type:complete len:225 (-),score=38.69 NODE_280_length_2022_cov_68.468829_g192_i0:415-1089(-)